MTYFPETLFGDDATALPQRTRPKDRLAQPVPATRLSPPGSTVAPAGMSAGHQNGRVTLTFNWPPDIAADVSFRQRRYRSQNDLTNAKTVTGRYRLAATQEGNTFLIRQNDLDVAVDYDQDHALTGYHLALQVLMMRIENASPPFRVTADGRYAGLVDFPTYRSDAVKAVTSTFAQFERENLAEAEAVADYFYSADLMSRTVAERWQRDVGVWCGMTLTPGEPVAAEYDHVFPEFGNLTVPMTATYTLLDHTPCIGAGAADACVRLSFRSQPTSTESREAAIVALNRSLTADSGQSHLVAFDVTHTADFVVDPHTMLPYRVEIGREIDATFTDDAGEYSENNRFDTITEYRYHE